MADLLEKRLADAMSDLDVAQRKYAEIREQYVMDRLVRVRAGDALGPLILTGPDRVSAERREAVARSNAEIDREVKNDPRIRAILNT